MLVDTHCHLDKIENLDAIQLELVKAKNLGIETIIIPTIDEHNFNNVLDLINKNESDNFSKLYMGLGIHPFYTELNNNFTEIDIINAIENLHKFYLQNINLKHNNKIIAVGEIGLDYYDKNKYNISLMKLLLEEQFQFAKEYNLPVIIHCRKAFNCVMELQKKFKISRGIFHAFNGSLEIANMLIKQGFYLGFGGAITYDKATKLQQLTKQISCNNIVLETDAPYMSPMWINKISQNTPSQLFRIAEYIANLKNISLEEFAEITTNNAKNIFNI